MRHATTITVANQKGGTCLHMVFRLHLADQLLEFLLGLFTSVGKWRDRLSCRRSKPLCPMAKLEHEFAAADKFFHHTRVGLICPSEPPPFCGLRLSLPAAIHIVFSSIRILRRAASIRPEEQAKPRRTIIAPC